MSTSPLSTMHIARTATGLQLDSPRGPLPLRQIIGIGRNYADHAKEQGAAVPDRPMLFTKNLATLALSGEEIVIPKVCQDRPQVDFEGELAVILGAGPSGELCKNVLESHALNFVAAYAIANDVSARWWQKEGGGGQFYRGKSFDTFCPLSTTAASLRAVPDPQDLRIITRVNGVVMQDGATRDMVFSVASLIHQISQGHTLLPGTVILTGTPSGVGMSRTPPVWLKDGDEVEVEIPGIGTLRNRVRME
jgi:2-keto-4-pentenoate hydratase/2-oxohepta-3-ene-1,7-dioic acid hydratase in catechol pathway